MFLSARFKLVFILYQSVMENNEKYTVGYSVLNPANNSDSDSKKSNGAGIVSLSIHIS